MSLLDDLRDYLQEFSYSPEHAEAVIAPVIDEAAARGKLIRMLERLDQQERQETSQPGSSTEPTDSSEELFQRWQEGNRVVRFARRMNQLLRQSMGRSASAQQLEEWIELAIASRLGLRDELASKIQTLEVRRLAEIAYREVFSILSYSRWPIDIGAYAAAIRATRGTPPRTTITPIGQVFLELTGRDAIRWLLLVEAAQSTGPGDPWRLSRETAHALASKTAWTFDWTEPSTYSPHSWETLKRLEALGLVSIQEGAWIDLNVLPLGHSFFAELAEGTESPMSVLADSLLTDLTLSAAESVAHPDKSTAISHASAATEATARQARLVAHELHNVLVPVKTALGALYREVLLEPPGQVLGRRRESIDRGIDSAFRFVDQLVRLSTLAITPPEPFDLVPAIREALATVEQETGRTVTQSLPTTLPPVTGHRARIILAIANVLRNAAQAVNPRDYVIRLGAETIEEARAVLITVEDNGPGIPADMRRAIFDEGVSLRPGGAGLGLALVREVIEKETRGLVACDVSSLGGARFVIRMPTTGAGGNTP